MSIRGGNGLGDAIYILSVARHILSQGTKIEICTKWPEVFSQLEGDIKLSKFRRDNINHLAHYTTRKGIAGTSQFTDVCINAGFREPIEFEFGWKPVNKELYDRIRSNPRPVIAVAMPRNPMGRTDGFGKEILPTRAGYQAVMDALKGRAYTVMIGAGPAIYGLKGVDLDLTNKTTVKDMFDVTCAVDGFLGFCSNFVPLAESQSKPALFVWARKNLTAPQVFVRRITPEKILHRETSTWVFDDAKADEIEVGVRALLKAMAAHSAS